MPELPEIETMRRALEPILVGHKIQRVTVINRNLRFPLKESFAEQLSKATITALNRRGKYLLCSTHSHATHSHTTHSHIWLIHCGMSGSLHYHTKPAKPLKHDHLIVHLDHGSLHYHDPRRFGFMRLIPQGMDDKALLSLGIEPLNADFTGFALHKIIGTKSAPIKNLLMNQKYIAGLGNIYVLESLHEAAIHPDIPASQLSLEKCVFLVKIIKKTLHRAIKSGGSTIRDYRNGIGGIGYFQHQFKVYGRAGEDCMTCQTPILRIVKSGRSNFFCPQCQSLPKGRASS